MNEKRKLELLAYAKVCFEHCTNPFETIHLIKKKVTADECRYLSSLIRDSIENYIEEYFPNNSVLATIIEKAEKEFAETQEEIIHG
jgi:hypothetical protein